MSKEIVKTIIVKDNEKEIKIELHSPSATMLEKAEMVQNSKIAELIRSKENKLLLRSELDKFLKETNHWTNEDDKTLEKLNNEVSKTLKKLSAGGIKLSKGRSLAIKATELRNQIVTHMQKKQAFYDSTIEAVAEAEKLEYIIYICTYDSLTSKPYWNSFEDMKEDKGTAVYNDVSREIYSIAYGFDANYQENLPENKWLKDYNFLDKDLNFVDRNTGNFVDRDGRPLEKAIEKIIEETNIDEKAVFIDDKTGKKVGREQKKKE